MTYDLRRLRRKGFIARDSGRYRYRPTRAGTRLAVFFTKIYARILTPALAQLDPRLPDDVGSRTPLRRTFRALDRTPR